MAFHLCFFWGCRLQKSNLSHRLHVRKTILKSYNTKLLPKIILEHAQITIIFIQQGRFKQSFRSIALSICAWAHVCSTKHFSWSRRKSLRFMRQMCTNVSRLSFRGTGMCGILSWGFITGVHEKILNSLQMKFQHVRRKI